METPSKVASCIVGGFVYLLISLLICLSYITCVLLYLPSLGYSIKLWKALVKDINS